MDWFMQLTIAGRAGSVFSPPAFSVSHFQQVILEAAAKIRYVWKYRYCHFTEDSILEPYATS